MYWEIKHLFSSELQNNLDMNLSSHVLIDQVYNEILAEIDTEYPKGGG